MAEYYKLGDNGWVSLLVEFGWLEAMPGTLRMPYTDDKPEHPTTPPIGLVALRDAVSRYQDAAVLVVSGAANVHLMPLSEALKEQPDGSLMVFGINHRT